MIKVFLSQPMADRTEEEIKAERKDMLAKVQASVSSREQVEEVDSYFDEAPSAIVRGGDSKALWYLGKSLQKMAEADVVVFAPGWKLHVDAPSSILPQSTMTRISTSFNIDLGRGHYA